MNETKNCKKRNYVVFILSLLLVLSVGVGIYYYKEACSWKNQAANDNYEPWYSLGIVASTYDTEDLEQAIEFGHTYNRGILQFGIGGGIYPKFQDSHSGIPFLQQYDSFARDIAEGTYEGEEKEQALQLFREMNESLLEICFYVKEHTQTQEEKVEFMNKNSELYKTVEQKNNEFCVTYHQKIEEFTKMAYNVKTSDFAVMQMDLTSGEKIFVIHSVEELDAYYENYVGDGKEIPVTHSLAYKTICKNFDKEYFENKILIIVWTAKPSSPSSHEITEVFYNSDKKIEIRVSTTLLNNNEEATGEHWFISPAKGIYIQDERDVKIVWMK